MCMFTWARRGSALVGSRPRQSPQLTAWGGRLGPPEKGCTVGNGTRTIATAAAIKTRPRGRARPKKKANGNGGEKIAGDELQKAYQLLLAQHRELADLAAGLQNECEVAHAYLDAAGAPGGDELPERLILVAKEWFRGHPRSSSDHISTRLRTMLLKAGEVDFIYSAGS